MKEKSIKKNYIYNMMYQILIIILPIITTPYLARTLGSEGIGTFGYTSSIITYFILFGSLGISLYGQREIAYVQNDRKKRNKIFYELIILRFITMFISGTIFYIFFARTGEYSIYYKILLIELFSSCLDISWLYQGLEEFKKIVIRNIIVKIVSIILIFTFIKSPENLIQYFLISLISTLVGSITLWINIKKYVDKIKFKELNILKNVAPVIALFIPQIAIQVYTVLDKTMIGSILNDMNEVGYYEQSQKIIKILMTLITSLATVMIPRIAKCFAENNKEQIKKYMSKSFNYTFFLSIPMIFGIIAVSDNFVPIFFGTGYEKVPLIMSIMSLIILFIGFSGTIGNQLLVAAKRQKEFTISVVLGAVVNFILNLLLINKFEAVGATIATVVAEFSVTAIQFYFVRNEIDIKETIKLSRNYLIAGGIMFAICKFIDYIIQSNLLGIITQVTLGVLIYVGVLLILKDKFLNYIIGIVKEKLRGKNGKECE